MSNKHKGCLLAKTWPYQLQPDLYLKLI